MKTRLVMIPHKTAANSCNGVEITQTMTSRPDTTLSTARVVRTRAMTFETQTIFRRRGKSLLKVWNCREMEATDAKLEVRSGHPKHILENMNSSQFVKHGVANLSDVEMNE